LQRATMMMAADMLMRKNSHSANVDMLCCY
jgi:hypothetical protein